MTQDTQIQKLMMWGYSPYIAKSLVLGTNKKKSKKGDSKNA